MMKFKIILTVEMTRVIDDIKESVSSCRTHIRYWEWCPWKWKKGRNVKSISFATFLDIVVKNNWYNFTLKLKNWGNFERHRILGGRRERGTTNSFCTRWQGVVIYTISSTLVLWKHLINKSIKKFSEGKVILNIIWEGRAGET